jgi:hypothetical protein
VKGANLKRLHTTWLSGTDKTMETVKKSEVARNVFLGWGRKKSWSAEALWDSVKDSVWYCDVGYMLYLCPNLYNVQHQEWDLTDYVLWVIMVCQHRFIDCKEYVSNGGAMPRCGGLSWESKTALKVRCWWLMPVSLASQEAEIRRVTVWGHLGKILCETPSQKYSTQKKGWWSDPSCRVPASVRPWIQTPVPPKEKKVTFLNKP